MVNDQMRILIIELWGLGDAVIMTAFLQSLPKTGVEVTVLCKPGSAKLLRPSYPDVNFIEFVAPWTAFRGKYHLWSWPWKKIYSLLNSLRTERFDVAVSVRKDPRDALLMWLAGARQRCGIPRAGSQWFLSLPIHQEASSHRVEDWWRLLKRIMPQDHQSNPPLLHGSSYRNSADPCWPQRSTLPLWVIHSGAGQPIRCWPSTHFIALIQSLRSRYAFQLGVIIDADGTGSELAHLADLTYKPSSIAALVQCLDEADLLIANDSGPGHIAAALSKPVISIFGSQRPEWFRPYGEHVKVVKLEPAPSPPRHDSGGEVERRCLVELTDELVFETIQPFLEKLITNVERTDA